MSYLRSAKRRAPLRLGLWLSLLGVVWSLVEMTRDLEREARSPYPVTRAVTFHPHLAGLGGDGVDADRLSQVAVPRDFALRRGENLIVALRRLGLAPGEAYAAAQVAAGLVDVRRLRAGDLHTAYYDGEERLTDFSLLLSGEGRLSLSRGDDGWQGLWQGFDRQTRRRSIVGVLDGSLEGSIEQAGGDPSLAYVMAEVLQWDLDFNRDLRLGDRFFVLYEEDWRGGTFYRVTEVLALIYENRGRPLEAYRFGEAGHYDAQGRPLQKQFLRSPLPYSRVTSRFSHRRYHPVLKTYRPHYGVDFGAPRGTRVRVTARGVVTFAGWDRGGGNTVKVRHPNGFLTAYLHLSRFARGLGKGVTVEQGQVIGYVGATGLATGSHLDYRVRHRGRWIDPLSLDNQRLEPIPANRMKDFLKRRDALRGQMKEVGTGREATVRSVVSDPGGGLARSGGPAPG